ncbi:MAG: SURF1 family protein [Pseudomonadota bacterium]|nr:SURF1 family protein [Pseudomonadota bacterium]
MVALVAITLFSSAGVWQLRRMHEKQALLDASGHVLDKRKSKSFSIASDPDRARAYDWVEGAGTFDVRGAMLLDNQQSGGRSGVRVYRIFLPEQGSPLLVDLGWLPLGGERKLPQIPRSQGRVELRGLLMPPPSSGLALGAGIAREGDNWLLTRVDPAAIVADTGLSVPLAPRVLRIDPALPIGYARDLDILPNTLPPQRHLGYAVQWFALALAVLVTAVVLTLRKPRR